MKALVQNSYGAPDALNFKEMPRPIIEANEVLVRVAAVGLNAGDYFTLRGHPWLVRLTVGFPKPKDHILGWDVAGHIDAVGSSVTQFQVGDPVYGACTKALAEYVGADADSFALKPTSLSFTEAAAVPSAAITALQGLRDIGQIRPGLKVLINGASGGVGTFAVQIAKVLGAEVTGVCSTRNVDMVRFIGADNVIDYTKQDFTQGEQRYDLILDNVANRSFADLRRVLTPQGVIVPNSGHGGMSYVFKAFLFAPFMHQQAKPFLADITHKDLTLVKEWIEAGTVKPVIDRTYPFAETPTALAYAAEGHVRGKVVIDMDMPDE